MTTVESFDYEALDIEIRLKVKTLTKSLHLIRKRTAADIIEIGEGLNAIRDLLRFKRPGFQAWCKSEGWGHTTAYRFIHAFEHYGKRTNWDELPVSVFYLLTQPTTPDEARAEIIDAAESGEITVAIAQGIITDHKMAMAATNNPDPETIEVNAVHEVASEIIASGHITLKDGTQVEPTAETIIPALHASMSERHARKGQHIEDSKAERAAKPVIVCLCGSTRFSEAYRTANFNETLAGRIVLTIGCDMRSDAELFADFKPEELEAVKRRLDELHLRKIDLADEILVLNCGGYVGSSTKSEIAYAQQRGKRIRWLEEPYAYLFPPGWTDEALPSAEPTEQVCDVFKFGHCDRCDHPCRDYFNNHGYQEEPEVYEPRSFCDECHAPDGEHYFGCSLADYDD